MAKDYFISNCVLRDRRNLLETAHHSSAHIPAYIQQITFVNASPVAYRHQQFTQVALPLSMWMWVRLPREKEYSTAPFYFFPSQHLSKSPWSFNRIDSKPPRGISA
ncbi:hypothetical protein Hypma_012116 [Hypsizygus marmoreus]|uniref:Uncharacterized protein n=1 Tax=Hypsizygus marmoreus TaxID=39966 RepID=A0A369JEY3_HYPMA|nr:hypothetical protein Hypma_012116 [Hypsizygus marmoreus]